MFNSTPTPPTDPYEQDLNQSFLDNPDLFPEITDPKQREEAVHGFEEYLKIINDIFKDQLREGKLDHFTDEDNLREEWQKRFNKSTNRVAKRSSSK
jgi:hypothetical protein